MAVYLLGSGQARPISLIVVLGVLKASLASGDGTSVHQRRGVNWSTSSPMIHARNSPPSFVARVEHTDQSEEMQVRTVASQLSCY